MFKHITCFVLVTAITLSSAIAGTGISSALKEFRYSVQVEWDGQDHAVYESAVKKLSDAVSVAQAAGVSNKTLIKEALGDVQNEVLVQEMLNVVDSMHGGDLSVEDAQAMLIKIAEAQGHGGAAWSGSVSNFFYGVAGVAILVVLIIGSGGNMPGAFQ